MREFFFYATALGVCAFAVLAVTARNIFHCALWLAMTLLSVAGIYFYLDAPFLGVIQILVYVGGIMTLFVFTIKLTAHIGDQTIPQTNSQLWPSVLAAVALLCIFLHLIAVNPWAKAGLEYPSTTLAQIGNSLMTKYALPFEFMSVILLAAMVGAIVIGKAKK